MKSHEVDYNIIGHDMQVVEIELDPGETVIAEAGAMNWMDEGISFEARMGDGSAVNQSIVGKLFSAGKRLLTGESLFLTHFTNQGRAGKRLPLLLPIRAVLLSWTWQSFSITGLPARRMPFYVLPMAQG